MNASISPLKPASRPATPTDRLAVGGLTGFSTCDWPGVLAATVFCQGCPWDCGYCHNPHLRPAGDGGIPWSEVVAFLHRRTAILDAIVFSGGEPTLQAALPAAMREVRAMGFRVGLHTAGPYPTRLSAALPFTDWVGFDAKAPFDRYDAITGVPGSGARAHDSLRRVLDAGIACEVRTTVHPDQLSPADIDDLAAELTALGVRDYAVQTFRMQGCRPGLSKPAGSAASWLPPGIAQLFARFTCRA